MDNCNVTVDNIQIPTSEKMSKHVYVMDKGVTPETIPMVTFFFHPSKPETWSKSIRQADKEMNLILSRMELPEEVKANKNDLGRI